jgi:SAM-dependent methyltransferase
VSCIGGGPGSDFLGILKYCLTTKKKVELKCQIMDRDPAWSESWSDVDDKVESTFRISTSYQPIDVADSASWGKFSKHFQADIFTLIYFVSEVYAVADEANDYFATLLDQMKPGATLLYVDNNDSRFTEWFDRLVKKAKLTVLKDGVGVEKMPWDEDKSDLEPYFSKFGTPKLNADIAYRIVRKPT